MNAEQNNVALARRQSLPPINYFTVQELMAMPPYWGWVDCEPKQGTRFRMLLGGSDDGVALRFFWNGGYERKTLQLWTELASRADWVVDVGAHTGAYSLAALAANRSGGVASFEPYFMNFARLNLNLRSNGFRTSHAWMLAVGERNEVLPFRIKTGPDYLTTGGGIGSSQDALNINVQAVSLDGYLPAEIHPRVSLMKLDVEGYEATCLRGMTALLDRAAPDIFFECVDKAGGQAVQAILQPLGYQFFEIDDHASTVTETRVIEPQYDGWGRILMSRLNRVATKGNVDFFRTMAGV
jgi:FkbM family methyltransferase